MKAGDREVAVATLAYIKDRIRASSNEDSVIDVIDREMKILDKESPQDYPPQLPEQEGTGLVLTLTLLLRWADLVRRKAGVEEKTPGTSKYYSKKSVVNVTWEGKAYQISTHRRILE